MARKRGPSGILSYGDWNSLHPDRFASRRSADELLDAAGVRAELAVTTIDRTELGSHGPAERSVGEKKSRRSLLKAPPAGVDFHGRLPLPSDLGWSVRWEVWFTGF